MGAPAGAAGPVTTARLGSAIAGGMISPMDAVRLTKWAFAAGTTAPWYSFQALAGADVFFPWEDEDAVQPGARGRKKDSTVQCKLPWMAAAETAIPISVSQTKLALPLSLSRFL